MTKGNDGDMDNIILIGFMGCGKTSVGLRLASELGYKFYDTDQLIEKDSKRLIRNIFEEDGEEYFRSLETKLIKDLKGKLNDSILSVGGGLPITPGNSELLKELGTVVYLNTSIDTIRERLKEDMTRPLLAGKNAKDMDKLYQFRTPIYEAGCHYMVETDNKDFNEIIEAIRLRIGGSHEIISD